MTPLLLLSLSLAARAETLSYADALTRALAANPTLLSSGADLDAAEGALLAAKGVFDPSLTGAIGLRSATSEGTAQFGEYSAETNVFYDSAGLSWFSPTGTALSLDWQHDRSEFRYVIGAFDSELEDAQVSTRLQASVSQALLQGWRMSYNLQGVRQAQQARDAAEAALAATRQQTLADVAAAYWGLWAARRQVAVLEQGMEVAREEQRIVRARVEAGALAQVEQLRVDALVVQAQSELVTARNAERAAADSLLVLLGEPPGGALELATDPAEPSAMSLDEEAIVRTALERNPTLQALALAEQQARDDLKSARHGRLPELNATASYALAGYEASFSEALGELTEASLPEWTVGANVSVPLGNRVDRGTVLASQGSARAARIDREGYERSLAALVRAQARAIETSAAQLELAAANVRLAEQTLAAERALAEVGRAVQKDVLEAIQGLDAARAALEGARADYALAIVELERLKGTL